MPAAFAAGWPNAEPPVVPKLKDDFAPPKAGLGFAASAGADVLPNNGVLVTAPGASNIDVFGGSPAGVEVFPNTYTGLLSPEGAPVLPNTDATLGSPAGVVVLPNTEVG